MAEELRLEYLGGMQVTRGGVPLSGFISAKAPALLCFLAVTGRPQFRLVLAGLLWGDLPEVDACANLRKTLSNLRELAGSSLDITPQTVTFDRHSPHWLDVAAFLERAEGSTSLSELRKAAELYQGDFLDGFYVRRAQTFDEWVLGQRERLRRIASHAFQLLASYQIEQGELAAATDYTGRLLALDPWQEEAHRQMMSLLVRSGQRSAALAQYETCRLLLEKELGLEPMVETTALYRRIRAMGAPKPHNLPTPVTSFVGRQAELARIAHRLADPDCRLLTILGPGGVGKSRLALQAAFSAQAPGNDAFLDGVYLVSLYTARSARALSMAVAGSLGLAPIPGVELDAELLRHLRTKDLLLVLDGFEQLVGEGALLSTILRHAPQVKMLVTSRQRLNLVGEWCLELGGLPYAPLGTGEGIENYGATQLFLQRAQQVCPELVPSAMDYQAISYICELVEGLPLAVELAAAWAKAMCCLDIARAIESGLDVLTAFQRDQPARHQSIRAAFEHSWVLLVPAERHALRRMAVFHGGFEKEATARVAGADLTILTALADKSLLRRAPSGRYEMHELLRQYAGEKLDGVPAEREDAPACHARYYLCEFLAQRERELRGGKQQVALERFRAEVGNVRAAWSWAITHGMREETGRIVFCLAILYEILGWWREAAVAVDLTQDELHAGLRLADLESSPVGDRRLALSYLCLGLHAKSEGKPADAEASFRRSLAILRHAGDSFLMAIVLDYLGESCASLGRSGEARELLQEALALHVEHGDRWGVGTALVERCRLLLGRVECAAG